MLLLSIAKYALIHILFWTLFLAFAIVTTEETHSFLRSLSCTAHSSAIRILSEWSTILSLPTLVMRTLTGIYHKNGSRWWCEQTPKRTSWKNVIYDLEFLVVIFQRFSCEICSEECQNHFSMMIFFLHILFPIRDMHNFWNNKYLHFPNHRSSYDYMGVCVYAWFFFNILS